MESQRRTTFAIASSWGDARTGRRFLAVVAGTLLGLGMAQGLTVPRPESTDSEAFKAERLAMRSERAWTGLSVPPRTGPSTAEHEARPSERNPAADSATTPPNAPSRATPAGKRHRKADAAMRVGRPLESPTAPPADTGAVSMPNEQAASEVEKQPLPEPTQIDDELNHLVEVQTGASTRVPQPEDEALSGSPPSPKVRIEEAEARQTMDCRTERRSMADIEMTLSYSVPQDVLRKRLEEMARRMSQKYGLSLNCSGNACQFSGAALKKGAVCITDDSVSIELTLGFCAKMFKGKIDKEVQKWMDRMVAPS